MRLLLIPLIALGGCCCHRDTNSSAIAEAAPAATRPMGQPIVVRFVSLASIAPVSSYPDGGAMFEPTLTYTNVSNRPVWIRAFSFGHPVCRRDVRATGGGDWGVKQDFVCGVVPPPWIKVKPRASHAFTTIVFSEPGGVNVRVSIDYRTRAGGSDAFTATSEVRHFGTPPAATQPQGP